VPSGRSTGASFEHLVIVVDHPTATAEWLCRNDRLRSISEKDDGMYDAINKGLAISQGSYLGLFELVTNSIARHAKCGKLYFERFPQIDVVFGDTLYIRPDGSLLLYRKATPLRWPFILACGLYVMSCSTFFRSTVFSNREAFNQDFRQAGDAELIVTATPPRTSVCTS